MYFHWFTSSNILFLFMAKKIKVSGVGCTLVDSLYNNVSFETEDFNLYLSRASGDGGLTAGHLVFKEEFEKFASTDVHSMLKNIASGKSPDKINIGGPAIIPLIHAAQLNENADCEFHIYAVLGEDDNGRFIRTMLENAPLFIDKLTFSNKETPSTIVLSDPEYNNGTGERIFINSIGAAWDYNSTALDENFFSSDIVVFGGTALVPPIHDDLTYLLKNSKEQGCITIVNTVYDFRNENANPDKKWPLGNSDESYKNIDLLIVDHAEALRLSGQSEFKEAFNFFRESGTGAVIITSGTDDICIFSTGKLFKEIINVEMPISEAITKELEMENNGDTTGCGDNFVGGVISSLVSQMQKGMQLFDLKEAAIWGIVSGGTSCFYMGGMYHEKFAGEKRKMIEPYYSEYKRQ